MLETSGAARLADAVSNPDQWSAGGSEPPLDLVHLARQSLGDHELEAELLGLFRLQAPALTAQLSELIAFVVGIKGKNRSYSARLGACGRGGARGPDGVAI